MSKSLILKELFTFSFAYFFSFYVCAQQEKLYDILQNANTALKNKKLYKAENIYSKGLKMALKTNNIDTVTIIYNKLGVICWKRKSYQAAIHQYKLGLKYDSLGERGADFYYNISLAYRKLGQKDSSLFYLRKSLKIYNHLQGSRGAYNVFLNAGKVFKSIQQYDSSISYLLKAHEGFLSLNDIKKIASTTDMIAQVQNDLGNTKKAYHYYFKSLKNRLKIGDSISIGHSYNNIAIVHHKEKKHDSAIFYYTKALDFKKKKNLSYSKTLFNLGISLYAKGEKKKAIDNIEKSLLIKKKYKDTISILRTINELIFANIEIKNFKSSKKYIDSSTNLLKNIEVPRVIYRNYDLQSYYYSKIGDFEQAYELQKKSAELYSSVFNEQQVKIVQELQKKYESKAKENENLKLRLENKGNQNVIFEQQNRIRKNNILIAFLGLFALFVLTAYLLLKQRQRVLKQEQEYFRLKSIYEGQETIKRSISKDLHDVVGSNLSGVKLKLEALSTSKTRELLEKDIEKSLSTISNQVRLISHRLSPLDESIHKYKLSEIMVSRLSEFQHYSNLEIQFMNDAIEEVDELNIDRQNNLYGILLELLNNISKHAQASLVKIHISKEPSNLIHLLVSDNGIGFDTKDARGIGLINIEQRTKLLKGISSFSNSRNGGTEFNLKFLLTDES